MVLLVRKQRKGGTPCFESWGSGVSVQASLCDELGVRPCFLTLQNFFAKLLPFNDWWNECITLDEMVECSAISLLLYTHLLRISLKLNKGSSTHFRQGLWGRRNPHQNVSHFIMHLKLSTNLCCTGDPFILHCPGCADCCVCRSIDNALLFTEILCHIYCIVITFLNVDKSMLQCGKFIMFLYGMVLHSGNKPLFWLL